MSYQVIVKPSAKKELMRLPERVHDAMVERLLTLETDPRPPGVKKLQGREGYRLRVGDYRILYAIDDPARVVFILAIAHRRDAYR